MKTQTVKVYFLGAPLKCTEDKTGATLSDAPQVL